MEIFHEFWIMVKNSVTKCLDILFYNIVFRAVQWWKNLWAMTSDNILKSTITNVMKLERHFCCNPPLFFRLHGNLSGSWNRLFIYWKKKYEKLTFYAIGLFFREKMVFIFFISYAEAYLQIHLIIEFKSGRRAQFKFSVWVCLMYKRLKSVIELIGTKSEWLQINICTHSHGNAHTQWQFMCSLKNESIVTIT